VNSAIHEQCSELLLIALYSTVQLACTVNTKQQNAASYNNPLFTSVTSRPPALKQCRHEGASSGAHYTSSISWHQDWPRDILFFLVIYIFFLIIGKTTIFISCRSKEEERGKVELGAFVCFYFFKVFLKNLNFILFFLN
jgi:hypothetical protein